MSYLFFAILALSTNTWTYLLTYLLTSSFHGWTSSIQYVICIRA